MEIFLLRLGIYSTEQARLPPHCIFPSQAELWTRYDDAFVIVYYLPTACPNIQLCIHLQNRHEPKAALFFSSCS